jgi:hypothetical protein
VEALDSGGAVAVDDAYLRVVEMVGEPGGIDE